MDLPDKRITDAPWYDTTRILAIIYTVGYFYIVYLMMTRVLPEGNEGALNQLIGALTIIQTGIVQYHFGGSKSAERAQTQIAASKAKSDIVMGEIAKAAPMPEIVQVTPAPKNPETGAIPAAEVVPVKAKKR